MKGIIYNVFEAFCLERCGADTYELILDDCGLGDHVFVGTSSYDDGLLTLLAGAAGPRLGMNEVALHRALGRFAFPQMAARMPAFVAPFRDPKAFLMTVDSIVHLEVRKLLPDARPLRFQIEDLGPDRLVMLYESPRQMYDFAEGLLEGVADHFGRTVAIDRTLINLVTGPACRFELRFGDGPWS